MKSIKLFFIATFLFTTVIDAQITKGNWMVGGNATMDNYKTESLNGNGTIDIQKSMTILTNPYIGYFPINKAVFGISSSIRYDESKSFSQKQYGFDYSFGPFARYYFLKSEKMINIFAEAGYKFGIYQANQVAENTHKNVYNFGAGANVFLNSSVAFEFMVNNNLTRYKESPDTKVNNLQLALGLQIFLEK